MAKLSKRYLKLKFETVLEKLDDIHVEAKKTNSRVTHLEGEVSNLQLNKQHLDDSRESTCPIVPKVIPRIEKLEKNLNLYSWIANNPTKALIITFFLLLGLYYYYVVNPERHIMASTNKELIVTIDSLIKTLR